MTIAFLDERLPDRFWIKCIPEPNSGCWLWIAGSINAQGHGAFWLVSSMRLAHVVSYEALVSPVPEGLVLDHLCRTPCCVNAGHLEPVTQRINVLRGEGWAAAHARQTHCKNGHALTEDNLAAWHAKRGQRACKQCRADRRRNRGL